MNQSIELIPALFTGGGANAGYGGGGGEFDSSIPVSALFFKTIWSYQLTCLLPGWRNNQQAPAPEGN